MINNDLGLTPTHLRDPNGTLLHIPYRVTSQGFTLLSPSAGIALVVLPISAIEDPTFLNWISQRGIYRIEDTHSVMARVGEGRVIDRLRRHRRAPMLVPGRVSAAFGLREDWGYYERRYLEARVAGAWRDGGNVLASLTFNWKILEHNPLLRADLDNRHSALQSLLETSERILDNDADEFIEVVFGDETAWPAPPVDLGTAEPLPDNLAGEVKIEQIRHSTHTRVFPHGCRLRYEDGRICALASVRRDNVVLHPGSSVYQSTGTQAGRTFRKRHLTFLEAAQVDGDGDIGTTRVTVIADSAAFLIKNVTGGRVHVAQRWQIV